MRKNCWEYNECTMERGRENARKCPVSLDARFNGVHGGICAGRACWMIEDTLCNDALQGDFIEKYKECGTRNFYEYVKEAEDNDLTPTVLLLKKMEAEI